MRAAPTQNTLLGVVPKNQKNSNGKGLEGKKQIENYKQLRINRLIIIH